MIRVSPINGGGATWQFASAENRDLFAANPEKYAPQFGGYCAYGFTKNKAVNVDPRAFTVRNDKLYLNLNQGVKKTWLEDVDNYIQVATRNHSSFKKFDS